MEYRDFLLDIIGSKLKRERHMVLEHGEVGGKRPDAILKSNDSIVGVVVMADSETDEEIAKRIEEFRGLGHPVYLLVRKGRHRAMTDMLFRRSLFEVKVITWDVQISF